jgi:hypothetical protein
MAQEYSRQLHRSSFEHCRTFDRAQLDTTPNDGRANLPVCPNLTASQRSNAGGTMGMRTREHRSARSGGSLGGAAAPPYLGGGVRLHPKPSHSPTFYCIAWTVVHNWKQPN